MMHDPLMSSGDGQNARARPDPLRSAVGLAYPRWPLLSSIFVSGVVGIACLFWRFAPCPPGFLHFACGIGLWPGWVDMVLLWGLFLIGWLLAFIFGYSTIEVSRRRDQGIRKFLRSISSFEPVRHLLYIYAGLAFLGIVGLAWLKQFQFVPFALATIVIFVALWVAFRRWRNDGQGLSDEDDEELLRQSIRASVSPGYIIRSLPIIRGIWPPYPPVRPGDSLGAQQPLDSV